MRRNSWRIPTYDELIARCADLEERVTQLEHELGRNPSLVVHCREAFRMTKREAEILSTLVVRDCVASESLKVLLWGERDGMCVGSMLPVLIHRIRRKLKPHGITVQTIRAFGFALAPDMRQRVKDIVAGDITVHGIAVQEQETAGGEQGYGAGEVFRRQEGFRLHQA